MTKKVQKELRLDSKDAASFLRDIADTLEEEEQLNIEFKEEKLIQPIGEKLPMRIVQDEEGLEIGFKIQG